MYMEEPPSGHCNWLEGVVELFDGGVVGVHGGQDFSPPDISPPDFSPQDISPHSLPPASGNACTNHHHENIFPISKDFISHLHSLPFDLVFQLLV